MSKFKVTSLVILFCICGLQNLSFAQTLHLYGGEKNGEYLGCLNCNSSEENSIWNVYGTYGSHYQLKSIWNEYGTYGDNYNDYSPWSAYGSKPPVVVDKDGNFYGYFTMNGQKDKQATFTLALTIYKYYELIRKDVSGWYKKIFE